MNMESMMRNYVIELTLRAAPIALASSIVAGAIKVAGPAASERSATAITQGGFAIDGLTRGLVGSGGPLHAAAARNAPWLVKSRPVPAGAERLYAGLGRVASVARIGLFGVTGTLGAVRAAKAVNEAGSMRALVFDRDGRGGALQAVGSAMLAIKHPVTAVVGGAAFAALVVNDLM